MLPPIPHNEAERLRMLSLYQIMDTAAEQALDDLTGLAATICETPIGLISLIDDKRQWFKSRVGLEAKETPREFAFCAHAIVQDELLIIEDATLDARFANNPLVTGDPGIRFYAGAPLDVVNGVSLGTLCVIDRKPRHLDDRQLTALKVLRSSVVTLLNLRRAQFDIKAIESLLPMCAWCRNVRTDGETWQSLHDYVAQAMKVSHGMCPSCERQNAAEFVRG
jgi:GAF domain-containing protein